MAGAAEAGDLLRLAVAALRGHAVEEASRLLDEHVREQARAEGEAARRAVAAANRLASESRRAIRAMRKEIARLPPGLRFDAEHRLGPVLARFEEDLGRARVRKRVLSKPR